MSSRFLLRLSAALVLAAFGNLTARAYDAIIVFGDSYNDVGNIHAIAASHGVDYPPPPYYEGRFSNGPIWIEHVAGAWGLPVKPSVLGGTDWAVGGAELLQTVSVKWVPIPSIQDQVLAYLASVNGKADPNALYVIEGGGNDILDSIGATPDPALGPRIAAALHGMVHALRLAGARSFLIPDLIDLGNLPVAAAAGPEFAAYAKHTTIEVNLLLSDSLQGAENPPAVEIYRIPVFQTFEGVLNSTTHFGFADVRDPCLNQLLVPCTDPDHTLWWDEQHPTEFGHAFFAILTEARVTNH